MKTLLRVVMFIAVIASTASLNTLSVQTLDGPPQLPCPACPPMPK
jgi:hypothetical protein